MRNKIQKSMMLVICITLLIVFGILTVLFYFNSLNRMKEELKQELTYIEKALDISGMTYLYDMDQAQILTRLTLIDVNGEVLYDSKKDEYTFQNHAKREEVRDALRYGKGEALRNSMTVGKNTYYYAILLKDGTVLRASKTLDYLQPMIINVMPVFAGVAVFMVIVAYALSKWQTNRLIQPINDLDLEQPLSNKVYEELTPLLEKMEQQNREKEEIANMRKEFSANVSHELKTPLTSISGYAEIMKNGIVREEDMIPFSEKIYQEASRLIVLIEDIMKLSKLDEKDNSLEKEAVDLYVLAQEVCEHLRFLADKHGIQIELSGESVKVQGIRQVLNEMLFNICENAVKYNKDGGSVKIVLKELEDTIQVVVEDTGIGIPEQEKERIFERFYRVDKSHSKESGGTGLGLSIVKHAAFIHGAEIFVDSVEGEGTKMCICFKKEKNI